MSQGSSRSRRTKWHNYGETESWGQIHTNISLILWTLALFLMSQFRSRYFLASNICGKNICIISSQSSLCVSCYLQLSWRVILAWWVIQEGSNTLILRSYGIVCSEIVFLSSQAAGKTDSQNNFIQKKKKKKGIQHSCTTSKMVNVVLKVYTRYELPVKKNFYIYIHMYIQKSLLDP